MRRKFWKRYKEAAASFFNACIYGGIFIGQLIPYPIHSTKRKRWIAMKGYNTADGYMGYVDGEYLLFASETDYREWLES